jgi:hypothetical protein
MPKEALSMPSYHHRIKTLINCLNSNLTFCVVCVNLQFEKSVILR